MSATWGRNFKVTVFGESHGSGIGAVIDGVPAGTGIDEQMILTQMERRKPGRSDISTARSESDLPEIISGVFNGKATGAPICAIIRNESARSGDYEATKDLMRPGHADYSAHMKFDGNNDYRGGGHFSGRLTAGLVFAGSIARMVLDEYGISIGAHASSIGNVQDSAFGPADADPDLFGRISKKYIPVIDDAAGLAMQAAIASAKAAGDSIGGTVECAVIGVPAGLGEPFFDSVESLISHMMFSIPGVKGLEFGGGIAMTAMKGSETNDPFHITDGLVTTGTNYNGGVNGGITNSMPVVFRTAFKPTASIAKKQSTVDITAMKDAEIAIVGRHDPCIVPRAVPVVEAAAAIVFLDLLMRDRAVSGKDRHEKH
jgi:chorismate synthase